MHACAAPCTPLPDLLPCLPGTRFRQPVLDRPRPGARRAWRGQAGVLHRGRRGVRHEGARHAHATCMACVSPHAGRSRPARTEHACLRTPASPCMPDSGACRAARAVTTGHPHARRMLRRWCTAVGAPRATCAGARRASPSRAQTPMAAPALRLVAAAWKPAPRCRQAAARSAGPGGSSAAAWPAAGRPGRPQAAAGLVPHCWRIARRALAQVAQQSRVWRQPGMAAPAVALRRRRPALQQRHHTL